MELRHKETSTASATSCQVLRVPYQNSQRQGKICTAEKAGLRNIAQASA